MFTYKLTSIYILTSFKRNGLNSRKSTFTSAVVAYKQKNDKIYIEIMKEE